MIHRYGPLVIIRPKAYVKENDRWAAFDLEEWTENVYDYRQDPLSGLVDYVNYPSETVERGSGDCEDYAVLAASCRLSSGADRVGIAACAAWRERTFHAFAYDDTKVYSSGEITEETPAEFLERTMYDTMILQTISSTD